MKQRNRLYNQARRSRDLLSMSVYRHFRNSLTVELRTARDEFFCHRLSAISGPSKIWKELSFPSLTKPRGSSPFTFFSSGELNSFYAAISTSTDRYPDSLSSLNLPPLSTSQPIFQFSEVIIESLSTALSNSHSLSLTQGPDSLSNFAILKAAPLLLESLLLIFNSSLRLSVFPSLWKRALVRPLLKVVPPASPSDTRPVSNLCELSKALPYALSLGKSQIFLRQTPSPIVFNLVSERALALRRLS